MYVPRAYQNAWNMVNNQFILVECDQGKIFLKFFLDRKVGFTGGHELGGDSTKALVSSGASVCPEGHD